MPENPESVEYRFKIDVFTPDSIPMARLAEYMGDLAALLGEHNDVQFVAIESGSVAIVSRIRREAYPKVRQRVRQASRGEGDSATKRLVRKLNANLQRDNGSAVLLDESEGAEIIQFPGRKQQRQIIGPIVQRGHLEGTVIVIGGESDPVPVHLQSGARIFNCKARRFVAKNLAPFLFEGEVQIYGIGRWYRDEEAWQLDTFTITDFVPLDSDSLSTALAKIHSIPGSEWSSLEDPWAELDAIRKGER